jgi:hypothetical protein
VSSNSTLGRAARRSLEDPGWAPADAGWALLVFDGGGGVGGEFVRLDARLDEGILPLCLPILVCMRNPYRYNTFQ